MAADPLFRDTNMVVVTSFDDVKTLYRQQESVIASN